ncbi:hypothetical protein C7212DRAFT_273739 [Tuber magnatum]|uniref:Uncharacterized protein n=1 Tax=Tuber magnatum TaxID=42249 RepID=A0A317T1X4_9PEZI|nr:hypothetical protein C7212DRAFT_273739 [Tuber magnatum]
MRGMLQFLRKSGQEIRRSVKFYTSKEIIIPCWRCERYVPIKVIGLLLEPDKAIEFKCKHCNQVVGFTVRHPPTQTSAPPPNWRPNGDPAAPFGSDPTGRAICNDPVSTGSQIYIAETGHTANRDLDSHSEVRDEPEPSPPSQSPTTPSSLKGKQRAPSRRTSVSYSERRATFRGTPSRELPDRSSSEYFGEDGSMDGNPRSRQSSVSLPRRHSPTLLLQDTMFFDTMADKPIRRHSWSSSKHSAVGPSHRSYSPAPPVPPMPGSVTPTSGTMSRRSTSNRRSEDYTMDLSASPRLSTESNSSQDWQHLQTRHSSPDPEFDQRRELPAPLDRNVSGKRRSGSQRSLHRAAVNRRQSIRLENEDESEAASSNIRRRDSMGSDFEVEPSDEQVRRATQIWSARRKHESADVKWARDILRRHTSWRNINSRYPNPLYANRESVEQFQMRPDNTDEGFNSGTNHHPQQPHPLTIPVFSGSAPGFAGNNIPTPVEEEPDSAGLRFGTTANRSSQEPKAPFGGVPEPSESSLVVTPQTGNIQTELVDLGGLAPPDDGGAPHEESTPSEVPRPQLNPRHAARRLRRRCRKTLKAIARKISSFRRVPNRQAAQAPTAVATATDHPQQDSSTDPSDPAVPENLGLTSINQDLEMHEAPPGGTAEAEDNTQFYSGEITHDPSEEEVNQVASEIALTINGMVAPLIQLEFRATPLELGLAAR